MSVWSSDVCSSDLFAWPHLEVAACLLSRASSDLSHGEETFRATMTISVCMASYNGAPYIEDQLRSILASGEVDEVLISADGSSDDSVDRIRAISDPRVRLVLGPGPGLVRNFEFLLSEARGRSEEGRVGKECVSRCRS